MSNKPQDPNYPETEVFESGDSWAQESWSQNPEQPQQYFDPPQPPQPQYGPPMAPVPPQGYVAEQQSGNKALLIVLGVLGAVIVLLIGAIAFLMVTRDDEDPDAGSANTNEQQSVVTQTVTNEQTTGPAPSPAPAPAPANSGSPSTYSVHGPTSNAFGSNVFDAYVRRYSERGSKNIYLSGVYSPTTGRYYDMNCADQGAYVGCYGGNDAQVRIHFH